MKSRRRNNWQMIAINGAALFLAATVTIAAHAGNKVVITDTEPMKDAIIQESYQAEYIEEESEKEEIAPESQKAYIFSEADEEMLMRIAMAEAESEGTEGKALVMLTVINRVSDNRFPDTIEQVIFQKKQFSTTGEGGRYWTTTPDEECLEALEMVESGWDESEGALFFEAVTNTSTWHRNNLKFLFQYGNQNFYTTKTEA